VVFSPAGAGFYVNVSKQRRHEPGKGKKTHQIKPAEALYCQMYGTE
jgi:hypothetical protein